VKRIAIVGLALVTLFGSAVRADDWAAPQVRNVFSENGQFFVRVIPGKSIGDTVGFAGAPKGGYARAEFYARQPSGSYTLAADVELVNPVSPVAALVTNVGYLITFDNWHNAGYGKVVAVYRPNGRLVRAFALDEIYSAANVKRLPHSVSSRWWRCAPTGYVDPDAQTRVFVREHFGGLFVFDVTTGKYRYEPGQATCERR
jgi:hypothetical protein